MIEAMLPTGFNIGYGLEAEAGDHDLSTSRASIVIGRSDTGSAVSKMAKDLDSYIREFKEEQIINPWLMKSVNGIRIKNKITHQEETVNTLISMDGETIEEVTDEREKEGRVWLSMHKKAEIIAGMKEGEIALWVSPAVEKAETVGRNNRIYKAEKKKKGIVEMTAYTVGGQEDTLWSILDKLDGQKHDRKSPILDNIIRFKSEDQRASHEGIFHAYNASLRIEDKERYADYVKKFAQESVLPDGERIEKAKIRQKIFAEKMFSEMKKDKNVVEAFGVLAESIVALPRIKYRDDGMPNNINRQSLRDGYIDRSGRKNLGEEKRRDGKVILVYGNQIESVKTENVSEEVRSGREDEAVENKSIQKIQEKIRKLLFIETEETQNAKESIFEETTASRSERDDLRKPEKRRFEENILKWLHEQMEKEGESEFTDNNLEELVEYLEIISTVFETDPDPNRKRPLFDRLNTLPSVNYPGDSFYNHHVGNSKTGNPRIISEDKFMGILSDFIIEELREKNGGDTETNRSFFSIFAEKIDGAKNRVSGHILRGNMKKGTENGGVKEKDTGLAQIGILKILASLSEKGIGLNRVKTEVVSQTPKEKKLPNRTKNKDRENNVSRKNFKDVFKEHPITIDILRLKMLIVLLGRAKLTTESLLDLSKEAGFGSIFIGHDRPKSNPHQVRLRWETNNRMPRPSFDKTPIMSFVRSFRTVGRSNLILIRAAIIDTYFLREERRISLLIILLLDKLRFSIENTIMILDLLRIDFHSLSYQNNSYERLVKKNSPFVYRQPKPNLAWSKREKSPFPISGIIFTGVNSSIGLDHLLGV